MRYSKLLVGAVALTTALTIAGEAAAFADDDARKAILDLRAKVAAAQSANMQLANQIEQLREQNAQLMGRLEKVTNEVAMQQRASKDLFMNLDKRFAAFESTMERDESGHTFTVTPEEKRRYDMALTLFSEGNYVASERLLNSIVAVYPKSGHMPNVLYWLGCAYFARNKLEEALETQTKLLEQYPKSSRVPEAMLSKAAAEASLGRKVAARKTLNALVKQYPGTQTASLAKDRLKSLGGGAAAKPSSKKAAQ